MDGSTTIQEFIIDQFIESLHLQWNELPRKISIKLFQFSEILNAWSDYKTSYYRVPHGNFEFSLQILAEKGHEVFHSFLFLAAKLTK